MLTITHFNDALKCITKGLLLILASFLLCPSIAQAKKTLTMYVDPVGAGNVSPGASTQQENYATVDISATPATSCYVFKNWTGSTVANPNSATTTIDMNGASRTVTAHFVQSGYTITASAGTGGTITPSGDVSICPGGSQTFTFSPSAGYELGTYSVDGAAPVSASNGFYAFTNVLASHRISVTFVPKSYTITASAGSGGAISPSGATTVSFGGSQSFFITASTGYSIDKVTVDGTVIVLSGNTYTFSSVNSDHSISVTFKGGSDGQGGTSYIPGCAASTYTSYSGGFNSADFTMTNTAVSDSKIVLETGAQSINPNSIIIPFEQDVAVTFIYELAGHQKNDFGWMLASAGSSGTKHEIYQNINDNDNNGVLDDREGIDANGDGKVDVLDNRVVIGHFAGGTELVFYLKVDDQSYSCFTKTNWNSDVFSGDCPSLTFDKTFQLGSTANSFTACGPSSWLNADAIDRLNAPPLNLNFGDTEKTISVTRNSLFPHVLVGSPNEKPNEWILGWEDLKNGGDYDLNDMVFRIDRQTGGSAQLQSSQAITPIDPDAYFTAVTIEVYDNMPCSGKTKIKYWLSIDDGVNWVEVADWDVVKSFSGTGDSKTVGNEITNWVPGSPSQTYRLRRVDFSGSALVGRQLIWKAEMFSSDENCVPEIIDVVLNGSVATHGSFSRASPSVQTNVLYSGSYETPALSWNEKVLRGHLYATRLYDPADPSQQATQLLWDAGAVLTSMDPANRKIYYPYISVGTVTHEVIGTGDGNSKHFSGTLTHHPILPTTVTITDSVENIHDKHTDVLIGDRGGYGTINRFTGVYDLYFSTPPTSNMPIVASYTYYSCSSAMNQFTTSNITNSILGLTNLIITDNSGTHYKYDLNKDGAFSEADGDWLVNWVRGYKDGASIKKEWLLGQIDHSVPAVQTPPGRPAWYFGTAVTDAERQAFDDFAKNQYNRSTVAYVGSRDGMLHAFNAGKFRWKDFSDSSSAWGDNPKTSTVEYRGYFEWQGSTSSTADYGTGAELWAFIPANLLARLKNNLLSGEDQAYVDASPAISDVVIGGSWKTVLLCAEGNGGDTVFCLDVTNPVSPTFLWEFADPDLFRSRSSPSVGVIGQTIYNGTKKWVAFFVSGKTYDSALYPSIYMIDIADGSVLKRIFLDSEPDGLGGVPSGQPAVLDSDGNGYIDRIYIGTDKGYLYKVTIPDNPNSSSSYGITNCVINTDFSYTDSDNVNHSIPLSQRYHPIYASPAVVVNNTFDSSGDIQYKINILFGTGDSPYYDENINTSDTTYHFFAYIDESPKDECNPSAVSLDWFYELPAGERIFASAFAAAGNIYFGTSTSETEDPCEAAGSASANGGRLYVMKISNGALVTPPITTGNILSSPVVDDQHLYIKAVGGGLKTTTGAYNNPIIMGGLVETAVKTWREIFNKDQSLVPSQPSSP